LGNSEAATFATATKHTAMLRIITDTNIFSMFLVLAILQDTKGNRTNGKLGTLLLTACAMPKNAAINESIYTVSQKNKTPQF